MQIYLVGGAVRDRYLNLPSKDQDWVVVGASPADMLAAGYKQVGADFPVFLHPKTQQEYALARTERKSGHGYQGFVCDFDKNVTLEEDLLRRDLTINAMAQDDSGKLIDPYGGLQDLHNKVLRHVSPAFAEDPLRVLRVARFAARFAHLGFSIAPQTLELMADICQQGELAHLTAERVWQETERAMAEKSPDVYFRVLQECGALQVIFPEIAALFGVPQPEKYHPEIDTGLHILMCLQQIRRRSADTRALFATLTHDLGKALTPAENWPAHHGHEKLSIKPIKALCKRLRVPNGHQELALKTAEFHTHAHRAFELRPDTLLDILKKLDALRKPDVFALFLLCCEADACGRTGFEDKPYPQADYLRSALNVINNIRAEEFVAAGLSGQAIGQAMDAARVAALSEFKKTWAEEHGHAPH
ncbi:MAG: multifunctional CCA addition/repair protein [Oceanospirillaceae bacterium]|nr:multifunctional CCA addition/repair protein [Oceanospirillaceae bacterium]MCP5335801.1 multifunctional CCA addition/repair protein [Oceanospirillaceae bacterium]MCP5349896.1 multifunctional CCA addition/repair protein [Oceanospirillaceae bacterium]